MLASGSIALLAIASAADNLQAHLYFPGAVWIVFGTFIAILWAYEVYCRGGLDDDEAT